MPFAVLVIVLFWGLLFVGLRFCAGLVRFCLLCFLFMFWLILDLSWLILVGLVTLFSWLVWVCFVSLELIASLLYDCCGW